MRFHSIIVLSLVVLSGCNLDGYVAGPITADNKQLFLTEVTESKELRSTYEYDDDFRLIRQVFYEDRVYTYEYEYAESNHPVFFRIFFNDTHRITVFLKYDGDNLIESRAMSPSGQTFLFLERFEYDSLNQMSKRTVYPGVIASYYEVEYTWDAGNIIETNTQFLESTEKILYDYDDRKNPMIEVYRNIGYNHHNSTPITRNNKNNSILTSSNFPGDSEVSTNLYSYITPGYPIYVSSKSEDRFGRKTQSDLTYTY